MSRDEIAAGGDAIDQSPANNRKDPVILSTSAITSGARRFENQMALVTGAAGGLGAAIAGRLRSEGAHVALCDCNAAGLAQVAERLAAIEGGGAILQLTVDVRSTSEVEGAVEAALATCGRVDVLVNNAGRFVDGRIENMTDEAWSEVIDINLSGAFKMTRAALPAMKRAGYGRIVSIASLSRGGNFGQANYSASKAGIVGMARTVALEAARFGITSNVISPGPIRTPMLAAMKAEVRDRMCESVPVGRIGEPADLAAAAAFLASPEASYITGVVLDVDGGVSVPFIRR